MQQGKCKKGEDRRHEDRKKRCNAGYGKAGASEKTFMNEEYENNQEDQYADDGVYGDITQEELQRLMDSRKQRYTEGYNKPIKTDKTVSVKVTIAILVGIFVYYMTFFALNIAGIISRLAMALCMLPMTIVIIVIYLIYRRRNQD